MTLRVGDRIALPRRGVVTHIDDDSFRLQLDGESPGVYLRVLFDSSWLEEKLELKEQRLKASVSPLENLQHQVDEWVKSTLGEESLRNPRERVLRFLEEAIELAQAVGLQESMCCDLVEFVFSRPIGETHQELGGAMLTALAAASSLELSAQLELRRELERVQAPDVIARVRRRQTEKLDRFKTRGEISLSCGNSVTHFCPACGYQTSHVPCSHCGVNQNEYKGPKAEPKPVGVVTITGP